MSNQTLADFVDDDIESNVEPSTTEPFPEFQRNAATGSINTKIIEEQHFIIYAENINVMMVNIALILCILGLFLFPCAIASYCLITKIKQDHPESSSSYCKISTIYCMSSIGIFLGSLEIIVGILVIILWK